MGLTSALFTTLTGLSGNQQRLDVIGNNIANVNTVGYKATRLDFQTLFSQTSSNGSPPSDVSGGTNPMQVGMGTRAAGVTRNYNNGSQEVTGVNTELAIQGNGFFILQGSEQVFSRDGTFKLNSQNELVNANGYRVQGYGIDADFNVVQGPLNDINIPLGVLTVAKATTHLTMDGNFNATGVVATTPPSILGNDYLYLRGTDPLNPASPDPAAAPSGTTLLTDLVDASNGAYLQVGDVINLTGTKGTRSMTARTLTVTATTTLADFTSFIAGTLGINTTDLSGSGQTPGVAAPAGNVADPLGPSNAVQLAVTGNLGSVNDLSLSATDMSITRTGGGTTTTLRPFSWTKTATANGESVYSPATVYDSLGAAVNVGLCAVLTGKDASGSRWEYFVESADATTGSGAAAGGLGTNIAVGVGTLQFNNQGQLIATSGAPVVVDRTGTGAIPALQFDIAFDNINALSGTSSQLAATEQDGSSKGVLNDFTIDDDGVIVGSFDNGVRRNLGQVALATFRNNQGLLDVGNNDYVPSANSGLPVISAPGEFSAGQIVAGALELSNVDLSAEFVNLISASSAFTASSRIISTSNQLLQDLLASAR